jgi:hypothetical protein
MARNDSFDVLTLAQAYENLTLDSLRPLVPQHGIGVSSEGEAYRFV